MICTSKGWDNLFSFLDDSIIKKNQINYFKESNNEWFELLLKCNTKGKELGYHSSIGNTHVEKHIKWTFTPWKNEKNKILGVVVSAQSRCDEVKKNNEIEKLNALLETKSEISKIGTWEYDLESNKLIWSKMTKLIHEVPENYEPDVETAIDFYKIGYSRNTISMLVHNAIESGIKYNEKLQIITKKGEERWVLSSGKPLLKNGKTIKIIGTLQDISQKVKSENSVRENEKLLYTLIDNLPLNVFIKDVESRKILVNKSECQFLGVDNPNEILGKSNFDLYDKEMAQILRQEDIQIIKNQKPIIAKEELLRKKDGSEVPMLISKIPLNDVKGETYALLGISMDISVLKQKENELRRLNNITSLQNKKLVNFAHIVSHNLRSHTANFSMLLEFLINEKSEKEKEKIIKMLSKASEDLLSTLDDLNEVIRINTNTNLCVQSIDLKNTFEYVHEKLAKIFADNDVEFLNKIPKNTIINGVQVYTENIILNLLTNAVKFRHQDRKPKIIVSAKKEDDKVVFSVKDNGLGIDLEKNCDKLFGMYKTFHNNNETRGIGLFIVKNQIEAMGGMIKVISEINKGSTFKVYFNEGY